MMDAVLVLNSGSSSIKAALFDVRTGMNLDRLHLAHLPPDEHLGAFHRVFTWATGQNSSEVKRIVATVHRVVHGGDEFHAATVLNDGVLQYLQNLTPLAPLHQPACLHGISVCRAAYPDIPHYACFDTAFHAQQSALQTTLPIPAETKMRRYGFHGLSYSQIARRYPAGRTIAAHLGSGSSVCAIQDGISLASTMGLTALDGLPMATRSGAIDAGAVLILARQHGVDMTEDMLYRHSGLLALSGISGDMHTLRQSADARASFAIAYFTHSIAAAIAALCVSMGGVDRVVFTGGIGENDAALRQDVCTKLAFLPKFDVAVHACDEEREMFLELQPAHQMDTQQSGH